jgi:hypothetical protein
MILISFPWIKNSFVYDSHFWHNSTDELTASKAKIKSRPPPNIGFHGHTEQSRAAQSKQV